MSKQDRQGVVTPADVEQKYGLGKPSASGGLTPKEREDLNKLTQTLTAFIASTNAKLKEYDEKLAPGITQTWFGNGAPTLDNSPATDWNTEELKTEHIGDIYCDKDNGNIYLFNGSGWLGSTSLNYIVKFTVNSEVYQTISVKIGNSVNAPATVPTSGNGSFIAWQLNGENVTFPYTPSGNTEITALFQ